MNVLVAPDKFKGTLTAQEVSRAIAEGLKKKNPSVNVTCVPLADGGEGTCGLLTEYFQGKIIELEVTGPTFEKVKSGYGVTGDGTTAFIEMARASGLQLVMAEKRNPLYTTTLGTGELIRHAVEHGISNIIMGIGGSGTNDAGMGVLQALGVRFLDSHGNTLPPVGHSLEQLHVINQSGIHPKLKSVKFTALCDVDNPLHGTNGAAYTYAPQKGASATEVTMLDNGLKNFERVVKEVTGISINFPGAGAGGGLPGGVRAFLNITMQRGMDFIIKATGLEEKVSGADVIFTGEGKIDRQTLAGKVVMAVGKLGLKYHKPVIAITGRCELQPLDLKEIGISKVISLTDSYSVGQSLLHTAEVIKEVVQVK